MNEPLMTREYLNDESFYRAYLRDHPERETSPWVVGMAAAGIVGGSLLAYKTGALRPIAEMAIHQLGQYRNSELGAVVKGLRNWTGRENLKGNFKYKMELLKLDINAARDAHRDRMKQLGKSPFITDREGEMTQLITQRNKAMQDLEDSWGKMKMSKQQELIKKFGSKDGWREHHQRQMNDVIRDKNNTTIHEQEAHVKRTGYRYATIKEAMPHLNDKEKQLIEDTRLDFEAQYGKKFADSFMNKTYDKNLLINNKSNQFSDLRDFKAMTGDVMDTIADDFTTPFVKINPIRMLYLNRFNAVNPAPTFHVIKGNTRQPGITSTTDSLGEDHIYVNGNVFNTFDPTKAVKENVRLVEGKSGPVARYYRNLAGLTTSSYKRPNDFWGKMKWEVGSVFKWGFQDEPIGRDVSWNYRRGNGGDIEMPNFMDPTTWQSYIAQKGHNVFKPYESARRIKLEDAFGKDADWIVFNNFRTPSQAGGMVNFSKQFVAGRKNLDEVTTATLFPYGFFERLNSTLNQIGAGLPNDSLGSAFSTVKDMMLYRVAPVWLGVEAWKYANYESESLLGFQFEDKFAEFYAGASTGMAGLRDAVGITDWAKHFAYLLPGGEQIADIPLVGNFVDLNQTQEETAQYWESGEDAVRKGRFWEFGNTPFTGGKIEYFQPNWVRRTVSDYEFTDTMYGSREEYFENHILPTPRHLLAPLNALVFDPYHWEEKHYYDRPYMLTGGIPVLEDFPLIGPVLSSTVGQVFKPEKRMHEEYWQSVKPEDGMYIPNFDHNLVGPQFDDVSDDYAYDPIQQVVEQAEQAEFMGGSTYEIGTGRTGGGGTGGSVGGGGGAVSGQGQLVRTDEQTFAAYTTPSGAITPAHVATDKYTTIASLNRAIKEKSLTKASTDTEMMTRLRDGHPMGYQPEQVLSPHAAQNVISNLNYNITEMGGAYGFFTETLLGSYGGTTEIAASNEMTSLSRNFWDMNIGNLGGDANEIFRRFLPRDPMIGKNYNPIANQMPSWMPGPNNFTDFQHGDPYTKVAKGEMRLPGEAYERLYDLDSEEIDEAMKLEIGPSSIGRSVEEIRDHLLRRDEILDEDAWKVTETGTKWHENWEQRMMNEGIGLDFEQYVKVDEMGIGGFYDLKADHARWLEYAVENAEVFKHYDNAAESLPAKMRLGGAEKYGGFFHEGEDVLAMREESPEEFQQFIQDSLNGAPMALIDPKTMSGSKYDQEEMFFYNVQQVNFYLYATGQKRGYLMHVDRDALENGKESGVQVHSFDYNPELLKYSYSKVEAAREHIKQGLSDGSYGRGDFYDMIDQYRILSDVAPYSEEYRKMKKEIRQWQDLTEEDLLELQEIDDQGVARKENVRMYDYRFKHANVEHHNVRVTGVIDNNTFTVEGFDNPIKLAGLRAPTGKDDDDARRVSQTLDLEVGDKVRIAINSDELNQVNNDTYKTISAVLYKNGINKNRQLLESGLVKEKENDFSPTSVHARFSPTEIQLGSLWETFAHFDSPYHTKFLQVRSPLEQYERREVYGKDWQEWSEPVQDFIIPWYQQTISRNPLLAMATGTLLGAAFGNGRFGVIVGAMAGLVASTAGIAYKGMYEEVKGERWVPERRQEEWEMTEYLDTLKYVKYRRLYEWAADEAVEHEGVDVRQMIAEKKHEAGFRDVEKSYLMGLKRRIHSSSGDELDEALNEAEEYLQNNHEGLLAEYEGDVERAINAALNGIQNDRELEEIGAYTARALSYYNESEKTMYGYDPGEPLQNFLSALPKKDRDYLQPFMRASEEDRDDILAVAPTYMRRVLQASYGMEVDQKEDLVSYFMDHGLPGQGWIGWDDRASLDDVKVKMVKKEKLDPSEFEIWPDDEKSAAYSNVKAPNLHQHNNYNEVREKLYDVLRGVGLEDIMIQVSESEGDESQVFANIATDKRQEIVRRMNEDAVNLL